MDEPLPDGEVSGHELDLQLVERFAAGSDPRHFYSWSRGYGKSLFDSLAKAWFEDQERAVLFMTPSADGGSDWFTEPTRKRLTEIVEPDDA